MINEVSFNGELFGLKIGMTYDECMELSGLCREMYKHGLKVLTYMNDNVFAYFWNEKLVVIEVFRDIHINETISYHGIPVFEVPRDILIDSIKKRLGASNVDYSDPYFIKTDDKILFWSESLFDINELDDDMFNDMPLENQLEFFCSLYISAFTIGFVEDYVYYDMNNFKIRYND